MNQIEKWRQDLASSDPRIRADAAEAVCLAGPDALPLAVDLVKSCGDDEAVQQWAVAALEDLGVPSADDVDALKQATYSESDQVVYWAVTLLGRLGEMANSCQSRLGELLAETSAIAVQQRAAWALSKMKVNDTFTLQSLQAAANSTDARLSRLATQALSQVAEIGKSSSE